WELELPSAVHGAYDFLEHHNDVLLSKALAEDSALVAGRRGRIRIFSGELARSVYRFSRGNTRPVVDEQEETQGCGSSRCIALGCCRTGSRQLLEQVEHCRQLSGRRFRQRPPISLEYRTRVDTRPSYVWNWTGQFSALRT